MGGTAPRVSVVITNRNGITERNGLVFLELVLNTLRRQSFTDFDITVVDDDSTDGSVEYLRTEWPDVRVVELDENMGFPVVVNRGIAATAGEYIALLNNDIELSENWLDALVEELDSDPTIGFVAGKVMRFAERDVFEQAGLRFFTCGRWEPVGLDERDEGQYEERRGVPAVTAAACMYRRAAIEDAGGFDEDYFINTEEADLCLRMLLRGYRGYYIPGCAAYHVRGGTMGRVTDPMLFYVPRNGLVTLIKDLPNGTLARSLPKIARYQVDEFRGARRQGFQGPMYRAWRSVLWRLPKTLAKRRRVQRRRAISAQEFESLVRTDYPLPGRSEPAPA
jgi:GT2 family glycosyltransferase